MEWFIKPQLESTSSALGASDRLQYVHRNPAIVRRSFRSDLGVHRPDVPTYTVRSHEIR
jgi:hypothetical protein